MLQLVCIFLAVKCFRGSMNAFIDGLHIVVAVKRKANYEKPRRFVAVHFPAAHNLNS
jgi:hypothetical protein